MASGKKNYELEIMISGGTDASLAASIRKARSELNGLERQAGLSGRNIGDSFGGMSVKGIDALGRASDKVFGGIVKGAKLAAAGTAAILGASTAVGMGFESQMSTVQAISQSSAGDMEKLTALAKEMGETTKFSAEEAGKGLEYMAMAGWKTGDMIGGLPGIMYLAAASGEELGMVSDIVTDAMTAFGMQANEAGHFADVLAQASSNSNTNVAMMGETFQYVAPVAGAFGYTIEDVAVATGLMANAGIKGQKAGTAMRTMLTNLAKPTKQMRGYMEALSISLVDGEGNMKPFRQQLTEMREAFSGLSEAEKAEYAAGIAGKEGMSGLLAIVTASNEDFEKLSQSIDNSTDAAKRMSKVRIDNLAGDLTLMKSAAEGAGIEIYEGFSGNLRELTRDATGRIVSFTGELREDMPTIQRQLKQFGKSAKEGFQPVLNFGSWCLKHPDVVKGTITGIVAAFGTFKTVQVAKNGIAMLGTLSGMVSAWPVAAAGLAAGAIAGLVVSVRENNKRLKREDMASRFGAITLSMEELDETARMIADNGNMGKAADAIAEMAKVGELAGGVEDANKTLSKLNWKIGMGFGLNDADQESYASAIDQMVTGAIETVQQSQYTAQISVRALFGEGSASGNNLISGFNDMYVSISGEVQELGKQLGDVYSTALEDGIIDMDEARTIQELQEKLATVTQQVSQAQTRGKLNRIASQYSGKDLDPETFKNLQLRVQEVLAEERANQEEAADWLYSALELRKERGEITPSEYANEKRDIGVKLTEQSMTSSLQGLNWSTSAITDAYSDMLTQAVPDITENFNAAMQSSMQTIGMGGNMALALDPEVVKRSLGLKEIDKAARDGIAELWEGMQPAYEQLQMEAEKYREAGKKIPQSVMEGLNNAETIGMIAGDTDVISRMMGGSIAENPQYKAILEQAQSDGAAIPEEIAAGIDRSSDNAKTAVNQLGDITQQELDRRFDNMIVNGRVNISLRGNLITPMDALIPNGVGNGGKPAHYAKGGLISRPTLSWFAEDSPEYAIPIDGSSRSLALWQEAGEALGAYEANDYGKMYESFSNGIATENYNSSSFAPVYSPTIQMPPGGGDENRFRDILREDYERFVEFMERYQNEKYRASFS